MRSPVVLLAAANGSAIIWSTESLVQYYAIYLAYYTNMIEKLGITQLLSGLG